MLRKFIRDNNFNQAFACQLCFKSVEIKMHMIDLHSFQYKNDRKYEYNTLKKKLKHLTDVHV